MRALSVWPLFLALLLLLAALGACRGPGSPATAQRPTVSWDTRTTHSGTFELEAGLAVDPGQFVDVPVVLKYGADERTEVFAGISPFRHVDRRGRDGDGIGDLVLGARHRFVDEAEKQPAFAGLVALKIPTADEDEGLGSGEFDASFAFIAQQVVGRFDLVGQAQLDLLGDPSGGLDLGQVLAIAASTAIDERFGAFGELAGVFVPDRDVDAIQLLGGLTYSASRDLVFDAGLAIGLTNDAPDFVLLVGFTRNFGR